MLSRRFPLLTFTIFLLIVAGAQASTVDRSSCDREGCRLQPVQVEGGPGEANRISFAIEGRTIIVRDAGAPLQAQDGCDQRDPNTATCVIEPGTVEIDVFGRDGNDTIDGSRLTSLVYLLITYGGPGDDTITSGALVPGTDRANRSTYGGPGRDTLIGSGEDDVLFGGDGEDTLRAGEGTDLLRGDGTDPDDADGESPANDVLDGGEGDDEIDYSQRENDVRVDLPAGKAGESGETDSLISIEYAYGGKGSNVMLGDDADNILYNASKGSRCGRGGDAIRPRRLRDIPYVPGDCERIAVGRTAEVSRPVVRKRKKVIRIRVFPFGERFRGTLEYRVAGKLVAKVRLRTSRKGRNKVHWVTARLNARGRRTSFAGKRLETRVKRPNRETVGFTIKLKG